MITISGTKEELLLFIAEEISINCPSDRNEISHEECESYNNCEECALDHEKKFKYEITLN